MASLKHDGIVVVKDGFTIFVMIGRSDGRHFLNSQVGMGSRLQHLLLDLLMTVSISSVVTGEKSDNLQDTTGVRSFVVEELESVLQMLLILVTK